jgi:hypothetical protein
VFGWGGPANGHSLSRRFGVVYDPVARANADRLRSVNPFFAAYFPGSIDPMIVNVSRSAGDSGSGVFSPRGVLAAVHWERLNYQDANHTGALRGRLFQAAFEYPVWQYLAWIHDTINGAGSSGPPRDESTRRRLTETTDGDLPMSTPPQPAVECDEDQECATPVWARAVLMGAGNYRGTALMRCAVAGANTCSFGGAGHPAGASARLPLGSSASPAAPGAREVVAWCQTTTAFPDQGSPAQPVLRVSFTNADPSDSPLGYGWWDVTPDQLGTGAGQTVLDTGALSPC